VLSCSDFYYAVQGGSNFWVCEWNPELCPFKWRLLSSTFLCWCSLCCARMILSFESVDEIRKSDHLNDSYWAVLSCGAIYHAVQDSSKFGVCGWNPKLCSFKWKLLSSTFLWYRLFNNLALLGWLAYGTYLLTYGAIENLQLYINPPNSKLLWEIRGNQCARRILTCLLPVPYSISSPADGHLV